MSLKHVLASGIFGMVVSGCALHATTAEQSLPAIPQHPSPAWVQVHLPEFRQAVEQAPTDENQEALARLEALARIQARDAAKLTQVNRVLTLAWDNDGRGGAVVRQPAYIHVLNEPFNLSAQQEPAVPTTGLDIHAAEKALETLAQLTPQPANRGYSLYEIKRWERFCDGGEGMDERDWKFILSEGGLSGVPGGMDCNPPTFDYDDYLSAWTRFCESNAPTRNDRDIIRQTARPRSVVNPCRALEAR